jgi:hypothetical protein
MTEAVFQFKAIRRKLDRQEQKAEFEAKNPVPETGMYGWPYGVAVPFCWRRVNGGGREYAITQGRFGDEFVKNGDGTCLSRPLLTSLAHPEWPYTGTPHEWPKFKI